MGDSYIELARTLTERSGAKPGPGREKEYADVLLAQMRKDKLLSVSVSERLGGPGLEVEDIARITFEISRQSGSAGLTYAMHMSQAYSVTTHGEGPFFDALQKRMIDEQLLIASGTSEKGPGGDILTSLCQIDTGPDGRMFVVKESPNTSYVDHAGLILVTANRVNEKGRKKQVLIVGDVVLNQFEPARATGFLGMQGILNRPYKFRINFDEDAIFSTDFAAVARQTMTPSIQIFWAAMWSGLAWSMVSKAKTYVSKELAPEAETTLVVQHELTRIVDLHHTMNAMIRDAIRAYQTRGAAQDMGFGLSAQINRLKVNCSEILNEIGQRSLGIIGIRGYATGGPYTLAEPIADAMSAPIMVSNFRLTMNTAKIERFVDERL